MNRANINKWTTLPLPTIQQWQVAVTHDHDLKQVAKALKTQTPLVKHKLLEKEWQANQLKEENGLVYHY
jgi:hypothetical protein